MAQHGKYPDTYYRVSLKAVIRNSKGEVLCVKEKTPFWELPGGGIDHGENVQQALARELREELGYEGLFSYDPIGVITLYDDPNERCMLLIGFNVVLSEKYSPRPGSDTQEVAWINPHTLKDVEPRGSRAIYHFAVDTNSLIEFTRNQ